jgi:hypothetical protein
VLDPASPFGRSGAARTCRRASQVRGRRARGPSRFVLRPRLRSLTRLDEDSRTGGAGIRAQGGLSQPNGVWNRDRWRSDERSMAPEDDPDKGWAEDQGKARQVRSIRIQVPGATGWSIICRPKSGRPSPSDHESQSGYRTTRGSDRWAQDAGKSGSRNRRKITRHEVSQGDHSRSCDEASRIATLEPRRRAASAARIPSPDLGMRPGAERPAAPGSRSEGGGRGLRVHQRDPEVRAPPPRLKGSIATQLRRVPVSGSQGTLGHGSGRSTGTVATAGRPSWIPIRRPEPARWQPARPFAD